MFTIVALVVAIIFIVLTTTWLKLHPVIALFLAAFGFGLSTGMDGSTLINTIVRGFGSTIGSIGPIIMAGAIIGVFLERSGGALKIAEAILKRAGEKQMPATMAVIGYIVSLPVFCDTGFIILSNLNKALSKRTGVTLASGAIALSLGLYATHTMVPPTPGPVAAAEIIGADIGRVILWGALVSACSLIAGWFFAVRVAAKIYIDPNTNDEEFVIKKDAPAPLHAVMPILLPLMLIVLRSFAQLPDEPLGVGGMVSIINFIGHPIIALSIGVAIALTLPKKLERQMLSSDGWVGTALSSCAIVILVTGAGGAFGKVLQASAISDIIGDTVSSLHLGVILPFLVAAAIKTAQGSSTVAIITTASLIAPLLGALGLDGEIAKALVVVAIGAGAMVVSHANDSYFWVVTQFSNMDVKTGYKLQSLGTLIQGTTAAMIVWILSLVLI